MNWSVKLLYSWNDWTQVLAVNETPRFTDVWYLYNLMVHKTWKDFSNCQIYLIYCGCNSPVYLCFRQLQQLGRDYRMVVTVHLQIENEAAKCRLKSEAKKHHRANCQSSLNCSGQSHQKSPQNLFFIWWYKPGVCMYFRGLPVLWSIDADWFGGDELFISSKNLFRFVCDAFFPGFTIHFINQYLLRCKYTCLSACQ